jgi:hypothetical protein
VRPRTRRAVIALLASTPCPAPAARSTLALAVLVLTTLALGCDAPRGAVVGATDATSSSSSMATAASPPLPPAPAPAAEDADRGARERAALVLLSGVLPASRLPDRGEAPAGLSAGFGSEHGLPEGSVAVGPLLLPALPKAQDVARASLIPGARRCYRRALESDPTQYGKLGLAIVVAKDGSVDTVKVVSNTGLSTAAATCTANVAHRMTFPPPTSGAAVTVDAVLTFKLG